MNQEDGQTHFQRQESTTMRPLGHPFRICRSQDRHDQEHGTQQLNPKGRTLGDTRDEEVGPTMDTFEHCDAHTTCQGCAGQATQKLEDHIAKRPQSSHAPTCPDTQGHSRIEMRTRDTIEPMKKMRPAFFPDWLDLVQSKQQQQQHHPLYWGWVGARFT